jgi:hypothetical protein
MLTFESATWSDIEALRTSVMTPAGSVEEASQRFATQFTTRYSSVVLARVFLVRPFGSLPAGEQAAARELSNDDRLLNDATPVLVLLGTAGRSADWNERTRSRKHRAIALLSSEHVNGIPMIAKLLGDLEVNLSGLDNGKPIVTRRLLGGRNAAFYVPDAPTALDGQGRHIIPAQDFVRRYEVSTVFGMGGAYLDGTLAVTVLFTTETLQRPVVDRFPSVISNFKMATTELLSKGRLFQDE